MNPRDNTAAAVLAELARTQAALDLPVRLRAWDGLARAYVSGDLDVEGDLTDALRRVRAATRKTGRTTTRKTGRTTARKTAVAIRAAARLKVPLWPPPPPPDCELKVSVQQMSRGSRAPGGGPFIESYIAPDMHMRPLGETVGLIQDAGFEVVATRAMREHYVRIIRAWLASFEASLPAVEKLLTAEQVRVWRLYLAGGALAFEEGRMGVGQILAVRPAS